MRLFYNLMNKMVIFNALSFFHIPIKKLGAFFKDFLVIESFSRVKN